ncbi:hypothetical protein EDD37DRAFT_478860 [Exophiala viscosa]|uniref:uncharacterized protein n=1 Tax=Exophiala viscosa TaxID=2486360 RepID=UPI0021981FBA|nr:hypothetical protein EDD37DRAFT_478860 [Exophiala viscosa]
MQRALRSWIVLLCILSTTRGWRHQKAPGTRDELTVQPCQVRLTRLQFPRLRCNGGRKSAPESEKVVAADYWLKKCLSHCSLRSQLLYCISFSLIILPSVHSLSPFLQCSTCSY